MQTAVPSLVRRFWNDRRGNIAIMSGLFMTVLMGFAALGVDVGKIFTDRRKAQGVVDLAAIAAANDLGNASKAATATVRRNGYSDDPVGIELGIYSADPAIAATDRFKSASLANANAARVTLDSKTTLMFSRMLTGHDAYDVRTRAIATRSAFASFAIGSRLVKIDNGLLNQLLGGLLGTNVSLSVMDYQALIDARLDLFDFMNKLGQRINVTSGTYDSILKSNVKLVDVLGAMTDAEKAAYGGGHPAVKTLSSLSQSLNGSTTRLALNSLIDIGPYNTMPIGEKPKLGITVAALDFLTATGQLANGQNQIDIGLNVNIPGIAGATLKLAVGERPKGTSWVTVGAEGASVHTAQTRLLLNVNLVGSGAAPVVRVPIYLELASATAKLTQASCKYNNPNASSVTLAVTPAVIDTWIADVSSAQFLNFKVAPNPSAATIVDTALLKVTARAHVTITNMSPTPVTFTTSDIAARVKKTVGTKDFTASLLSKLVADADLNVNVLGLGIGLPGAAQTLVAGILSNAVAPLDTLLSGVLNSLGVGLGQADVWVLGQRCDGAVLVN